MSTLKELQQRWDAEESKLGKILKYYIGYLGIAAGSLGEGLTALMNLYTQYNIALPEWLTHTLVGIGIVGYLIGKLTKAPTSQQPGAQPPPQAR